MKRILRSSIYICAVFLVFLIGVNVQAATRHQIVDLKQNTWTKAYSRSDSQYNEKTGEWDYTRYYYLIKVPSSGYLSITTKDDDVSLHTKPQEDYYDYFTSVYAGESKNIAVDKGIYYLYSGTSDGTNVFCSFKAVTPTRNYCFGKAFSLKAGSTVTACMSKNHYYSRWYKIKLKKKQSITIWSNMGNQVYIYNARGKRVDTEHAGTKSTKYFTKKQKKGTYYIRIRPYWERRFDVITLKWQ